MTTDPTLLLTKVQHLQVFHVHVLWHCSWDVMLVQGLLVRERPQGGCHPQHARLVPRRACRCHLPDTHAPVMFAKTKSPPAYILVVQQAAGQFVCALLPRVAAAVRLHLFLVLGTTIHSDHAQLQTLASRMRCPANAMLLAWAHSTR